MARAVIALGSNLEPELSVQNALRALRTSDHITTVRTSAVYATTSVGPDGLPDGRPDFHNAAVLIETDLAPGALRAELRAIEGTMGRRRTQDKFAPRTIDLDIVFYDSLIIHTEDVRIPDPTALTQAHIVVPLAEVAPDWRPPGGSMSAAVAARGHRLSRVT